MTQEFSILLFKTKQQCEKNIRNHFNQLFDHLSDILNQNKEIYGENYNSVIDKFIDNSSKIQYVKTTLQNTKFGDIYDKYKQKVFPFTEQIDMKDEDFFLSDDGAAIYGEIPSEYTHFFKNLWILSPDDGGLYDSEKDDIWDIIDKIVKMMKRWGELKF
jgi:hypothetical protein